MIGIVTIIDNNNYGNRLQNFALSKVLNDYGYKVFTLKNESFSNEKRHFIIRKIKNVFFKGTYSSNDSRRKNFENFNKIINFTNKNYNVFSDFSKFDFLVVGSDQVWNPFFGRFKEFDLLNMVEGKKRISYAASFGVSSLNSEHNKILKNEISKFKAVSVREEMGKRIIKNVLPNKNVDVLIDPTMLLSADEWETIIKKPEMKSEKKFILNYFLGDLSENRKKEIYKVAKENNCEVINILDKKSPFYECGPSEFLYLEKQAFLICTDSFHSSVFAILFNTPFLVFDREKKNVVNMNSRLDTLLSKFNLQDRKYKGKISKKDLICDYKLSYKILDEERKKADKFLRKALDIKDSD